MALERKFIVAVLMMTPSNESYYMIGVLNETLQKHDGAS